MQSFTRLELALDWASQQGRPVVFLARDPQDLQSAHQVCWLYEHDLLTRVCRAAAEMRIA